MPFYKAFDVEVKVICNMKRGLELQGSVDASLFLLAKDIILWRAVVKAVKIE
jgi:hypothetical protein